MIRPSFSKRTAALVLAFTLSIVSTAFAQKTLPPKQRAQLLLQQNIIATGLNQAQLENFIVTDAYDDKRSGSFQVYLQQIRLSIPVYNKISIYTFRHDSLIQKKQDFIRRFSASSAKSTGYFVDAGEAVRLASNHFSIPLYTNPELLIKDENRKRFVYRVAGLGIDSTTSELVWLPIGDGNMVKLAWNVRIVSPDKQGDWFVRIDAQTGEYLNDNSLIVSEHINDNCAVEPSIKTSLHPVTDHTTTTISNFNTDPNFVIQASAAFVPPPPSVTSASYRVYPLYLESQNFGARVLEMDPWLKAGVGNNATTLGWHFDNTTNYELTRGNNVWAQEDLAGANATTGLTDNSTTSIPALTFDKPLDLSQNPSNNSNMRAAIDNLFYWNNILHDVSYQYGFDEAAGNFQASNLGRGGIGNDHVHAFAESGAGMNNANFNTPPDGQNPTMRMYQWNNGITPSLQVTSPSPIPTSYNIIEGIINLNSQLGYTGSKTANIVRVLDAGGNFFGCGSISNAAALNGNIALVDRGSCNFGPKIKNIQNAGAIAVIVVNNAAGAPFAMSGSDLTITIPAVMISIDDGAILKNNLTGLSGTLSSTGLFKDGSLDNGIIAHEYTHGISNRLTGGPASAGCLANAEQMGEGWSDYVALMLTTNWAAASTGDGVNARSIGTYALSQTSGGGGIRTYPYSTNMTVDPWTYGMMAGSTGGEVHTTGEIWCSALWDMTWNIIQQEGIHADIYQGTGGNNIALQLVIAGMKYQPCSPGFLDARDAILKADSILYGYAHKCAIWNAFARRGMGRSASQGSSNSYTDQIQAMDVPVGLGVTKTADKSSFHNGDNITYTINAYCDCGPLSNISIVDTLAAGLTYVSSSGGTYTAPVVRFNGVNFAAGEVKTFTIQATASGNPATAVTLINDTQDPANYSWSNFALTGGTVWSSVTTRSHSASHAWFAPDPSTRTDFVLTSGNLLLDTLSVLSFWHYFETDPGYDGGLVEISTDGGFAWQDLGAYMTMNRYNSSLDPSTTGVANRAAFTGSSGGVFIQTVITLTGFAGTTARIRFRFTSDVIDGGAGWWVDDIVLKNEKGIVNNAFAYNGTTLLSKTNTYGFLTPGVVLPVHFISFDAKKEGSSSALHWRVADEVNVKKYVVERSADGADFQTIGEVAYNAIGGGDKDYYFTDRNTLPGDNFYRISEQDIDGRSTLSGVRIVRFTSDRVGVILSPVPTYNHKAQLIIGYAGTGSFNAYLINNVGQVLKVYKVQKGVNELNLENFVPGVYYLKVELNDGQTEVKKLIIQ
jgi:extracellular elastinolytic metalloproteinase